MTSKKSPGFWFFTGDWLKDSELRFCSLFARGLLVDLLCLMFEAKEQGYLSKPDGSPRLDEEIVAAISGASVEEKLAALKELEASGVLDRDNRGVLFSRRLARLAEISKTRSKVGSKGGSKTQAKPQANAKQNDKQKQGVTVTDSVTDSDTEFTHTHTAHDADLPMQLGVVYPSGPYPSGPERTKAFAAVPPAVAVAWDRWCEFRLSMDGRPVDPIQAEAVLMDLARRGEPKAVADIEFSIRKGSKSILDSDHDFEKQRAGASGGARRGRARVEI
jgi:hypothetical protein